MKKLLISVMLLVMFSSNHVMAVFAERVNDPLVANDIQKNIAKNTTLNFTIRDFTESVNPPSGGSLVYITLTQLPNSASGILRLGAVPAKDGQNIKIQSLDQLNFVPKPDYVGEAIFTWEANYGSGTSPYPSAVVIRIGEKTEQAPITEQPENSPEPSQKPPETEPETNSSPPPSSSPTPPASPTSSAPATEPPVISPSSTPSQIPTETPTPTPDFTPPSQKPLQYEDMLDHWGAYSAGMLAVNGIVVGEEIGGHFYFRPDTILTRIDFITLACSVFDIKTKDSLADNPFADTGIPAYVLRQGIAAYEAGLIQGKAKSGHLYLNPYENITRAEAAKILDNGLNIQSRTAEDLSFADSQNIPQWAKQAVTNMEAYGIIRGFEDNTFRPYAKISKAQAGELLYQTYKYLEKSRKSQSVFNQVFYGI